jgi:hypothetical protein
MMGRQGGDQCQLLYLFNLEWRIPARHLLRRVDPFVTQVLADLRGKLAPFYSDIGRPSIDPELMIRSDARERRSERRDLVEIGHCDVAATRRPRRALGGIANHGTNRQACVAERARNGAADLAGDSSYSKHVSSFPHQAVGFGFRRRNVLRLSATRPCRGLGSWRMWHAGTTDPSANMSKHS